MRRISCIAAIALLCVSSALFAGPQMTVTLKDKSMLRGELVEFKDGVYRLKTASLGEVKIPADDVLLIRNSDETSAGADQAGTGEPARERQTKPGKAKSKAPAIREGGAKNSAPAAEPAAGGAASDNLQEQQKAVNSQVQSMMMNGSFLDSVTNLAQNQKMQDVLQDPQIMEAIQKGDYNFLMNSDKMKNLIDSSEMNSIMGGMSQPDEGKGDAGDEGGGE